MLRDAAPAALALAGIVVALLTQFALTEDWGLPWTTWWGFVPAGLLLGGAALLLARTPAAADSAVEPIALTRRQEMLLLAAVIALAAFFRLWRFYDFPPGIWFDEGINATDAIFIIDRDHFILWRDTVQGRPTMYLYLLAGSFKMFGYNLFALRIVPVMAGLAAVVAFYVLARSLVGVVPAMIATALLAVSRWATTFSRISWEAALVPVLEIMSVYFLLRALETRSRWFFIAAGTTLAAGLYTYVAFRIVPVVLLMFLAYIALTHWRLLWRNVPGIVIYAAAFFVVVAPLAQFALTHQDAVLERSRNVNIFQEIDDRGNYDPLRYNIEANIQMMNIEGDKNPRHNIHREAMLDEVTAALFVLGVAAAIWSIRDWRRGGILFWYALMLLPAALTITIENPSGIRAIGAIPPLYLLVGMAVATTYRAFAPLRNGAMMFGGVAVLLVGSSTAINYYDLFERQANDAFVYEGFEPRYLHVAEIVADRADEDRTFVSRAFDGNPAVRLYGQGKQVTSYIAARNLIFPADGRDVLLIMDHTQFSMFPNLQRLYPNATRENFVDDHGQVFFAEVTIPADDIAALHRLPAQVGGEDVDPLAIDHEWTEEDLARGPLSASWRGYIWTDTFPGETTIAVKAPGDFTLEVGEQRFTGTGELEAPVGALTYGEHEIRLSAEIAQPGRVEVIVNSDGRRLHGDEAIYATSFGDHGFRSIYRDDAQFSSPAVQVGHMPFATAAPPIHNRANVELQGILDVADGGEYSFALEGWNSAQLFVDDQLVVDNGGAHGMRRIESTVLLDPGEHVVSIQYISPDFPGWTLDWRRPGETAWTPMDGSEFRVPTAPYAPPAIVELQPDTTWGQQGFVAVEGIERAIAVGELPSGEVVLASKDSLTFIDAAGAITRTVALDARDVMDVVATANGHLVVLEREGNTLLILDAEGNEIERVTGEIASAGGLGVLGDIVYITSPAGGLIYGMTVPGGEVRGLGISDAGMANRAVQPSDIAAAEDGTLFVADFERRMIVVGTEDEAERVFSGAGGSGDQLPRLAISGEFVFVSEGVAERILIYDRDGKQRGVYVFAKESQGVRPANMAVSSDGKLYVADLEHNRVYRFVIDLPEEPEPLPEQ